MEGFTLVLLIAWLLLIASFGAMAYMDNVTKQSARPASKPAEK